MMLFFSCIYLKKEELERKLFIKLKFVIYCNLKLKFEASRLWTKRVFLYPEYIEA